MKAQILSGKFYRKEDGVLREYKAGDIVNVSPAESRYLHAKPVVAMERKRVPKESTIAAQEIPAPLLPVVKEMTDKELLEKYVARQTGSWYVFTDGSKHQGTRAAVNAAKELES